VEREAQATQYGERDVALAAFDRTVIGPIHASYQGKLFLRQADVLSLRPDPPP